MNIKEHLLRAIEAGKTDQIQFLQRLIQAASPNPPGDTQAAAAVVADYLHGRNIPYETITADDQKPNIVSEFQGESGPGPRVVLNGHIDVFPVGEGEGWTRDPWSGDVQNGRIYGRGVVDMKSGTASLVAAYAHLYEKRAYLKGSVAICLVSDEETGGKLGTTFLLDKDRRRWGGDVMLSAEPTACNTIRFAEKGTLRLTVDIKTKGAHGAYLNLSLGAIRTASVFLNRVVQEVEAMKVDLPPELVEHLQRKDVQEAIDEAMGPGTSNIVARPTVNIGTIRGGLKVNMIPDLCTAELDIRLPIGLSADQVLNHMRLLSEGYGKETAITLTTQTAASNPSSSSPISHPMVDCLASNAKYIDPASAKPVAVPSMGATDCKHYRYAGIAAYAYGCSPTSSEPSLLSMLGHP